MRFLGLSLNTTWVFHGKALVVVFLLVGIVTADQRGEEPFEMQSKLEMRGIKGNERAREMGLVRRQEGKEEPSSGISGTTSAIETAFSASASMAESSSRLKNKLLEDVTLPSLPESTYATPTSEISTSETDGATSSGAAETVTVSTASTQESGSSTTMEQETDSGASSGLAGSTTISEGPTSSTDPAATSSMSDSLAAPVTEDAATSMAVDQTSTDSSSDPAPPPPEPSSSPAAPPEPTSDSSQTTTEQHPPGPVETTIVPPGASSIARIPSTVVLTATGSVKAMTITRSGSVAAETVLTANPAGLTKTTTTAGAGTVTGGMSGSTAPANTTSTATGTKTHTVIINPSAGIRKLIPFVLEAKEGDVVELILYESDPSSDAGSGSNDQVSEEMVRLNRMKLEQDCQPLDDDPKGTDTTTNPLVPATSTFDASRPFTIPSSPSSQPILLGSTDQDSCHSGMVLMINMLAADVEKDELTFADGIKADGSTIADVLRAWESISADNAQALKSFESSAEMKPAAWAWGQDFGVKGLEGMTLDSVVQNILYTRLTLALNPALSDLYASPNGSTTNANTTARPNAVTELTANDSFLTSLIGSSTTAYGGNAMGITTGLPASLNGSNEVAMGRGKPSWSLVAVVLLACLYGTCL